MLEKYISEDVKDTGKHTQRRRRKLTAAAKFVHDTMQYNLKLKLSPYMLIGSSYALGCA